MPTTDVQLSRVGAIGGGDVGAILGISHFKTAAEVWDRIMGLDPHSDNDEAAFNEEKFWTIRGLHLESHIARLYQVVTGRKIESRERCFHPQHSFLRCTADQYILPVPGHNGEGVLEIKSLGPWTFKQALQHGIAPEYYAQLQHYLFVAQKQWGAFAVMNSDYAWILLLPETEWQRWQIQQEIEKGFIFPDVDLDNEWLSHAVPKVLEWWHTYVESGTRPPLVAADLERTFPRARVGTIPEDWSADPAFNAACAALKHARTEFDLAEHNKEMAETQVKLMMGEVEVALSVEGKVSWKEGTRRNFNYKRLLQEHPEINADLYYDTTVTRTFRPGF